MGKSVKKITSNPLKSIVGGGLGSAALGPIGSVVGAGAASGAIPGLDALMKGQKQTYNADPLAGAIKQIGAHGADITLGSVNNLRKHYDNATDVINKQIGDENNLIRTASADAQNRARQLINQRGMQNSSVGLGQEVAGFKKLRDSLATNNASFNDRMKQNYQEQLQLGTSLLAQRNGLGGPIQMKDVSTRRGGIAQLVGTLGGAAAGGLAGGAGGAQAGAQLGSSLGGYYQNS